MRIFNITFEATKTCQNGNERRTRTNVLVNVGSYEYWDNWDGAVQKAIDYLKNVKHYYHIEYVSAKPVEVVE